MNLYDLLSCSLGGTLSFSLLRGGARFVERTSLLSSEHDYFANISLKGDESHHWVERARGHCPQLITEMYIHVHTQ